MQRASYCGDRLTLRCAGLPLGAARLFSVAPSPVASRPRRPSSPIIASTPNTYVVWKLPGELSTPVDPSARGRPLMLSRLRGMGLPLPKENPVVVSPLEFNADGVVVLTTNTTLAAYLNAPPPPLLAAAAAAATAATTPAERHARDALRVYRVRINGRLPAHALAAMARGARLGGVVQPQMLVRDGETREGSGLRAAERARRAAAVAAGQPKHRAGAPAAPTAAADAAGRDARANVYHTVSTHASVGVMRALLERYGVRVVRVTRLELGRFHLEGLSPGSAMAVQPVPGDLLRRAEAWAAVQRVGQRKAQGLEGAGDGSGIQDSGGAPTQEANVLMA